MITMSNPATYLIEFCICTYNRCELLQVSVEALLRQILPATGICIVDNNSEDGTKAYGTKMAAMHDHLRYVEESRQGLSHARNTAWQTSQATWIFYLDDDCIPPPDLVSRAFHLANAHPGFAAIGGPILPVYQSPAPAWFPDGYGRFETEATDILALDRQYIRGGNMMIRREALAAVGGFDDALGVRGDELGYGEELDLQDKLREKQFRIAYDPQLVMHHLVRSEKMSLRWLLRSEYARRRDKMRIAPVGMGLATYRLTRTLIGRLFYLPYFLGQALFDRKYHGKAALHDSLQPVAYRLGEFIGSMKRKRHGG